MIQTLPLTQRLVLEVHRELLTGVRGQERQPGTLRRSPVWIGSPSDSPDTATFVPPLPEGLGDLLADWERYVNEPAPIPTLVRGAMMHFQFEARVERSLGVTNQGARNLIRDAQGRGWVRPLEVRGRRQYWLAADIFQIIEAPPLYERQREPESAGDPRDTRTRHVEDS